MGAVSGRHYTTARALAVGAGVTLSEAGDLVAAGAGWFTVRGTWRYAVPTYVAP
jgi:hypothetical protein